VEEAASSGYINDDQRGSLDGWRRDQFGWGDKHGFPKE
jgi:hypothetical protein